MKIKLLILVSTVLLNWSTVLAQLPVEVFGGHERATVDVLFFRYFKNKTGEHSRWLFFNRNRASIDYRITKTTYLPQFGFTEAISYNHESLRGFAPVLVGQVLSWGVYPKAGVQFVHLKKEITIFTWLVAETLKQPDLDYFLLLRYTPKLTGNIKLFTQVESVNTFPTLTTKNYSFTQRLRLGISMQSTQVGVGADFTQIGNTTFTKAYNTGCFIRYEF